MKACTKCGVEKDESEFYKSEGRRLRSDCKKCTNERSKSYALNHPDKLSAIKKKWLINNPDKRKEVANSWAKRAYYSDRFKYLAKVKNWQRLNPEKKKAIYKNWCNNNQDKIRTSNKEYVDNMADHYIINLATKNEKTKINGMPDIIRNWLLQSPEIILIKRELLKFKRLYKLKSNQYEKREN